MLTPRHLTALAALLAACARAPQTLAPPVAPRTDVTAARCGADPNAAWLHPSARVCAADADCVHFEGSRCEMVAMASRAAEGGAYDAHRCLPVVEGTLMTPSSCACAIPLTELRCARGCCQLRIAGADGLWTP